MKRILLTLVLSAWGVPAAAEPGVRVENAWVREAPPGARMLAGYLTLDNPTARPRVLVAVHSPAFRHVMLHKSEVVDGIARMSHQDGIPIPAQGSVNLEPGGFHLMMPTPDKRLTAGERVEFIFTFADGNSTRVQAEVRKKP